MQPYAEHYYAARKERIRASAEVIVPLVLEIVQPRSVIDVGCGTGEWLSVFQEHGIEDVLGVDGAYVSKKMLEIPEERFMAFDLEQPLHLDRKFDLVVSLEVAEHLPEERAEPFVSSLTGLGPVVLFSAAIPHQGGKNHINEQWPEYWAEHFCGNGYVAIDCLRSKVWWNEKVQKWYAQNTLMFVAQEYLEYQPVLKEYELRDTSQLSVVHPNMYLRRMEKCLQERENLERRLREIEDARVRHGLIHDIKRIVPRRIKELVRAAMMRVPTRTL